MDRALADYLGDGLHVEFDGGSFKLWCERENGVSEVYLDGAVLASFLRFVETVKREVAA